MNPDLRRIKPQHGFTLLELLISIGLTSILMVSLFAAMNIYMRLQVDSYEEITRQQVSRALLRRMTRDIQSVVFEKVQTTDDSETATTGTGSNTGGSTAGGSTAGGSTAGGSTAGGSTAGGSTAGGSTAGGSTAGGSTAGGTGTAAVTDDSATTAAMLTYTNGLVGTANDLLLYVSSPDKSLSYVGAQDLSTSDERTGDRMIVRYLVADTVAGGLSGSIAKKLDATKTGPLGLVRITGDLFGMSSAVQSGKEEEFTTVDAVEAKEVSMIEFRYFDGLEWQETWDSTVQNALPSAIEIVMTLRNPDLDDDRFSTEKSDPYALGETIHRTVVALPVAEPFIGETAL